MSAPSWADLEAIFHEALARAPADWVAFLAERCADRPELRAEVEALLCAHDGTADALEMTPVAPYTLLKAGLRGPDVSFAVGHFHEALVHEALKRRVTGRRSWRGADRPSRPRGS